MHTHISISIYIYTYIYTHIHIHTHTYAHISTLTPTYIKAHIYTHIQTHVKLSVICFENPHTQISDQMATSQLNHDKSQILVSTKCETFEQGIPEQNPVIKANKSELK